MAAGGDEFAPPTLSNPAASDLRNTTEATVIQSRDTDRISLRSRQLTLKKTTNENQWTKHSASSMGRPICMRRANRGHRSIALPNTSGTNSKRDGEARRPSY